MQYTGGVPPGATTPPSTATTTATSGASFGYRPALDGLRGLALLAIVAFHAQIAGVEGAFLSVSTFFTLSGFLITSVALAAHRRDGHVGIRDFYVRRVRRLLPAAIVAIAGITVVTALVGDSTQRASLRGDGLSALFYVANWRLILTDESYGAIFESPSLFTHFWTLAIEEQFYLAFPLAMAAVLAVGRGSRRVLALTLGAAIVGATAWTAWLLGRGASIDRLYFGTDTRIAEILVGCLAAVAWERFGARGLPARAHKPVAVLGVGALAAMGWLWHIAERTTTGFYRGGLVVYALLTVTVIVAALQDRGPATTILATKPLVALGGVSYAAYLIHWPVLVVLQERTPLTPWPRFIVGLAITLALSVLSLRFVERPVRTGRWPSPRHLAPAALGAAGAVTVLVLGAAALRPATVLTPDYEAAARQLAAGGPVGAPSATPPADVDLGNLTPEQAKWFDDLRRIEASTAPRVAFFGDSTATMTGFGVADWATANLDQLAPGLGQTDVGCGLLYGVTLRYDGGPAPVSTNCDGWRDRWVQAVTTKKLDIAAVQFGPWDVRDTQLEPDGPWLVVGRDAELDQALTDRLDDGVRALLDHVGTVVLVVPPDVTFGRVDGRDPPRPQPDADPARMEAFRRIVRDVASRHDRVRLVDLHGYLQTRSDDARLRPDGIHFTAEGSDEVATWLAPELLRLHTEVDAGS